MWVVRSLSGRLRAPVLWALVLAGLLVLSIWTVTASTALQQARISYARGNLTECLQHALDHLGRQPWSREAALLAARSFSRLDYSELAEPYFRRAGRLSLSDLQIRAYGITRGPHPEAAVPVYREILAREPGNVTAMRRMAAVLLVQDKTTELLELADRLSQQPTGTVIGATLRAMVLHNDDNPQSAVPAFERVLALDPDLRQMPLPRGLFWSHFASDLAKIGRVPEAQAYLNKVTAAAPDYALMNQLGGLYFLQGAFDDAERCYRQAIEWGPDAYGPYLNLARLARQRARPGEALEHLRKARLLAPQQYEVLYNLAAVYRQLGQTAEADRTQETLNHLRGSPGAPTPTFGGNWPRYAL